MEPTQQASGGAPASPSAAEIAQSLRSLDAERYLTVLLAPKAARDDLVALYGFNLEVAKIREITRETLIGAMRVQWWRDAVEAIFTGGRVPYHGVAQLLADTIRRHDLPRQPFDALLDARELDLDPVGPADMAALEAYAAATGGGLVELALRILGAKDASSLAVARDVGTGWALLGVVRATPFWASRGQTSLPADLRALHGVGLQSLYAQRPGSGIAKVSETIASRAQAAFERARSASATVPRRARSPLLLASLADAHFADLAAAGYDPFRLPEPRKDAALRLGWRWLRGRF